MAMTGGTAKLVSQGTPPGWPGPVSLYVYYKEDSQSIENNQTVLSLGMYVTTPNKWDIGGWTDYNGSYVGTATSGANCKTFDGDIPNFYGTRWLVENQKVTVTHNADGTKTATIYWHWGVNSGWSGVMNNPSGSFSITLTTIARKSSVSASASSVQMGNAVTINISRASTAFTHTLTYTIGGSTGTIATGVGTSYKWTVPDLAAKISGKTSDSCTITCDTYNGSTKIGSSTTSVTLTVPGATTPTLGASSVKMGNAVKVSVENRGSSNFTHTITYSIGSGSGTIKTGLTSYVNWTVTTSLAAYTSNKTSATCTITCVTYNGAAKVGTKTVTLTLTVPDATVPAVSASTVAMGSSVTISMPKKADVYTHDLTYSLKAYGSSTVAATGTIQNGISADKAWTIPLSLAAKIPSATKGTITITCTTRFKDSTTTVGSNSVSITATVPENSTTRPSLTMALSCVSDLPSKFAGIYIAGKTKVKVTHTATSSYSTIASYKTTVLGANSTANPYTSALLAASGTVTVTGEVFDSRGYSTTASQSIEVIPYSRPRIIPGSGQSSIICKRCNSDGKLDAGGAYLLIKIGRKYSKVVSGSVQKNYCKLSYRHKKDADGDSAYSDPVELLAASASSDYVSVVLSGIVPSNTIAYTVQLIAEDDVGEKDTVTVTVPTAFITFHSPEGGHGFTLGGYHDASKYDVFDCWFDAEFHGDVTGLYSQGETDGWYWRKYSDGIAECWRRVKNTGKNITTQFGSMYYCECDEVEFPFSFYSAPVVNATVESGTELILLSWQGSDGNGTTTASKPASYRVIRPTTITGASFTIAYHAIGRWK